MLSPLFIALFWIIAATILSILANWALKLSQGFKNKILGVLAISLISLGFGCMGQAILIMPLAIAYAIWCVLGIIGTALLGLIVFKQKLSMQKYIAIALLGTGVVLMSIA